MESPKTVARRRDRATEAVWRAVVQFDVIDARACARMADACLGVFPEGCRYDALFKTFYALDGKVPDREQIRTIAWAAAANVPLLRAGTPVAAARPPAAPERATVLITASAHARFKKQLETAARFRGRIVVGPGTPAVVEWVWSLKFVSYAASRPDGFGFAARRQGSKGRLYQHFSTLVGMRMSAKVADDGTRVRVSEIFCTPSMQEHNKELTERRFRNKFSCPFDFSHSCHHCPKGLASCPAACRRLDLVDRECPRCRRVYQYDADWRDEGCPSCRV